MIMQSPHTAELLESYHEQLPQLEQLIEQASNLLKAALREQNIQLNTFEGRIKTEESLAGKLEKKGYKYRTLHDVTDVVGIRVVTYYTDDVDKVAAIAKQIFDIDWKNSVDKRKHQLNSFGYLSLHYICYLKEGPLRTSMCGRPLSTTSATKVPSSCRQSLSGSSAVWQACWRWPTMSSAVCAPR